MSVGQGVKPRVLVVDDEAPIRQSLLRLLTFNDYDVVMAEDGPGALNLLTEADTAVIISDHHLPRMAGVELLRKVRELSPTTSRILFSGHIDIELIRNAVNTGEVYRFVTKPWSDEELLLAVANGIERWELMLHNRELQQRSEEQNAQLVLFNQELERMVAARTEALELRNRALSLSQEVLDGLPVLVVGIDPVGQVALANTMARRAFPNLMPGDVAREELAPAVWSWASEGLRGKIQAADLPTAIGRMRFEAALIGERGLIITAIPVARLAEAR